MTGDFLILIECGECGHQHFFEPDSMPGGSDHCPYCELCCAPLDLKRKEVRSLRYKNRESPDRQVKIDVLKVPAGSYKCIRDVKMHGATGKKAFTAGRLYSAWFQRGLQDAIYMLAVDDDGEQHILMDASTKSVNATLWLDRHFRKEGGETVEV